MSNNCNNAGFGMQKSKDDMSRVLAKSTIVFSWSFGILAQSLKLWAKLAKKLVQYVFS
jgi:hypothetical protein